MAALITLRLPDYLKSGEFNEVILGLHTKLYSNRHAALGQLLTLQDVVSHLGHYLGVNESGKKRYSGIDCRG